MYLLCDGRRLHREHDRSAVLVGLSMGLVLDDGEFDARDFDVIIRFVTELNYLFN